MKFFKISATLLILMAGCTPEVSDWTPAESPKENKVERFAFTHTIHYPAHAPHMEAKEKKELFKFLKKTVLNPWAVNVILEEYGGHSEERIKVIERELLRFGIPYELITSDYCEEERYGKRHRDHLGLRRRTGSYVELTIERYMVIPPACADFSQTMGNSRQENTHSNFGCAVMTNLGMMVANPRDLILGRPEGDSDGDVIAAGVLRYRTDQVKALMDTSTTVSPENATATPTSPPAAAAVGAGGGAY